MGIAFGLLFNEAVYVMNKRSAKSIAASIFGTRGLNSHTHYYLVILAISISSAGFWVIYENKDRRNKPHFTSWHSWAGCAFFALLPLQTLSAYRFFNSPLIPNLGKYLGMLSNVFTTVQVLNFHRFIGKLMAVLAGFTLLLGSYSNWAEREGENEQMVLIGLSGAFLGSTIVALMT
jgi:hypothetical protein